MKKIIAVLTAMVCVASVSTLMPVDKQISSNLIMTAYAEDDDGTDDSGESAAKDYLLTPGRNAATYDYEYADSAIYQHSISQVSMKKTVNSQKVDISTWKDSEGFTYGIFKTTITDVSGDTKTVVDTNYRVGVVSMDTTVLEAPKLSVNIPEDVQIYIADTLKVTLTDANKVTVIGNKAFAGSYLKAIDLTDVVYISDGAFSKCQYLPEVTLPGTVRFIGKDVFSSSGLKTLNVNYNMVIIPEGLCTSTQITAINFDRPELIKYIGPSAFKKSPIDETLFDMWKDTSGCESIVIGAGAFNGCTNMTKVVIPDNVIGLDKGAFRSCANITSLVFGANVGYADANCFASNVSLKTIKFNDKLYSLGGSVFSGCTALVEVDYMPNTLKDWVAVTSSSGYGFGNSMFAGCTSLKSVKLPTSITKIPTSIFSGCTSLNYIYNSDNITSIGKDAFKGCTNLLEAVFPKVTKIEASAFQNCAKLKTFSVGTCTSVGSSALEGCKSLTSIKLLADTYGDAVFRDCTSATTITFNGTGMQKTPDMLFYNCTALKKVDGDLSNVTIVSPGTFALCTNLVSVNLPKAIIIEANAFAACSSLESMCTGDITAKDFGDKCFYSCENLKQRVNSSASTIGVSAFENSGITELLLDNTDGNTMVIGKNAFASCKNLTTVEINASSEIKYSVGSGVFSTCTSLKTAVYSGPIVVEEMFRRCTSLKTLNTAAITVEKNAFAGCSSLTFVYTMDTVDTVALMSAIGDSAFINCESLRHSCSTNKTVFTGGSQYENCINLTKVNVGSLTKGMFKGCTALTAVDYIASAVDIPAECFQNCEKLEEVDLSKVLTIGSDSFSGSGITKLTLDNAQSIGASAFAGCNNLKSVDINVDKIGASAFANSQFIENATICATSIGDKAFQDCASLRRLTLQESTSRVLKSIGARAFDNCNVLLEAVVPGNPEIGTRAFGYMNNKVVADYLLVGEMNSTVYNYASSNKIAFCNIKNFDLSQREQGRKTPGDVDGNGLITIVDAVKLQSWLLGKDTPGVVGGNMDLNGDGRVDVFDMVLMRKKLIQ